MLLNLSFKNDIKIKKPWIIMTNQQEFKRVGYKTGGHLSGGVYKHKTTGEKFLLKIPNNQEEAEN